MIESRDEVTIARLLRIAMGYGSREERYAAMTNSEYLEVRWLTERLVQRGLLRPEGVKYVP